MAVFCFSRSPKHIPFVSAFSQIKFSLPNLCYILLPKKFFISAYLLLVSTRSKSANKFQAFSLHPFLTSTSVSFSALRDIFLTFLPWRTGFLRVWDLVISIPLSVNAVVHFMWTTPASTFADLSETVHTASLEDYKIHSSRSSPSQLFVRKVS